MKIAPSLIVALLPSLAVADDRAIASFADNCFSPFMTAARAESRIASPVTRVDFYDLMPFSASNAISPARGRPVTPNTDRRCEVAFDGARINDAFDATLAALAREGIDAEVPVPDTFALQDGTELVAARALNPARIAVVQLGLRPGPNGQETFMNVERLTPAASAAALNN